MLRCLRHHGWHGASGPTAQRGARPSPGGHHHTTTFRDIRLIHTRADARREARAIAAIALPVIAAQLLQMGMGESVVNRLNEFVKALNEGRVLEDALRTSQNTTPTTMEEFSHVFKAVYNL